MAQDFRTVVSPEVRQAVIQEYAEANEVPLHQVEAGFGVEGALVFDSIIGVEMSVGLEQRLGVSIPEEQLLKSSRPYRSLRSYSEVIQRCVDAASGGAKDA